MDAYDQDEGAGLPAVATGIGPAHTLRAVRQVRPGQVLWRPPKGPWAAPGPREYLPVQGRPFQRTLWAAPGPRECSAGAGKRNAKPARAVQIGPRADGSGNSPRPGGPTLPLNDLTQALLLLLRARTRTLWGSHAAGVLPPFPRTGPPHACTSTSFCTRLQRRTCKAGPCLRPSGWRRGASHRAQGR